ncbi:putative N-acetylated-alpha-linked acidic dipeptidase [Branchiostoma floridae]|uniref:Glutamate carboxypeptidase 2 n=1 Tax=Branchiostoma floridae TaxID=7739 RepID=A0A9J7MUN1_BRAFL|nr:putative N-acetylated-alpha-linked acidic dipeptidase [Branchiostoma floridae]
MDGSRGRFLLVAAIGLVAGVVLGVVIGYFSRQPGSAAPWAEELVRDGDASAGRRVQEEILPENIEENLRRLTSVPHIAGREMDLGQAEDLRDRWLQYGLDSARLTPYDILLSYPSSDENSPSRVTLMEADGTVVIQSQVEEAPLDQWQDDPNIVPPFNAYSGSGDVEGELVYVNYGRVEDFFHLQRDLNIDPSGKICIARYGSIFRGDKAEKAEQFGCLGLIIYSDPADYSARDYPVYPDGWMLPPSGVQRGTLMIAQGDPLTPFYPANEYAYRLTEEEAKVVAGLPGIPVHPIGFGVGIELLRHLAGDEAPEDWRGDLNITYRTGPGFQQAHAGRRVRLQVNVQNEVKRTYNVIGIIEGSVEPDRYVIMGNHRDAWVFGSVDPSSGTAVQEEVARAFGKLKQEGWRPRRSLVFASWGAEEYGLIGSTEWVEEYSKVLQERAVAYLNVDIAALGNYTFRSSASPAMFQSVFEATKKVPDPGVNPAGSSYSSLYDSWAAKVPKDEGDPNSLPNIGQLGSGSDYTPFFQHLGISSIDFRFICDPAVLDYYALYHSSYETFDLVKNFIDPEFKVHQAVGRVLAEMALDLADSLVLPIDPTVYSTALQDIAESVRTEYSTQFDAQSISMEYLDSAVSNFTRSALRLKDRMSNIDKKNPLAVRVVNDQLMQLERGFIDPLGLPGREWYRHVVYAPSAHNSYAGQAFPGLADAMFDIENAANQTQRWEEVKKQLAIITYTVQSAATAIEEGGL